MSSADINAVFGRALAELAAAGRRRDRRVVTHSDGPLIDIGAGLLVNFASNDYLGLAGSPVLAQAVRDHAMGGATASRLVVGNHAIHEALEAALAHWLGTERTVVFASGYAANVGTVSALVGADDEVFSDALNHASIIDGCRLARARVTVFPHRDLAALDHALATSSARRRLIISETLFSMDGDLADVAGLAALRDRHGAWLMLDEAHALGVNGPAGTGVAAAAIVRADVVVGTFGKSFGAGGAFVASQRTVCEWIWNRARSLVFSTGLAPAVTAAAAAALPLITGPDGDAARARLAAGAAQLHHGLRTVDPRLMTHPTPALTSPIVPVIVGDDARAVGLSEALSRRGYLVPAIRYPTVAAGTARLRISLRADHTPAHIDGLVAALADALAV